MQINKKLYTTFIISILTLSILVAAIPMASAAITTAPGLSVATGTVGTTVTVTGSAGAGDASPFSTVTLYWDSLAGAVLGTTTADNTGAWTKSVKIPSATTGAHFIVASDGVAFGASFTVTANLAVDVTRVLPGDSVVLTGHGYGANKAVTVKLDSTTLGTPVSITLTTPAITTNATGSFTATIVVPATITSVQYDVYTVTATDATTTAATASITINNYINVTPTSGPTGITITMAGRIPASTAYELRFNGATVATGTTDAGGIFSQAYVVPSVLSTGPYAVDVVWATVNTRSTTFTVTAAPTIVLGATSGVAGTVVTITGAGFSSSASITLYFGTTVVNSTALDSRFGKTSSGGTFSEDFTVPVLTPGVYAVRVTDQYGASTAAIYTFLVLPTPVTIISIRAASYCQGDSFSFDILTTETGLGTITVSIYDPTQKLWWMTNDWTLTTSADGTYKTVIYQDQGADAYNQIKMTLPADAPLGAWNWTITYTPVSSGVLTTASSFFNVTAPATMQTVLDKLDVVRTNITTAITTSQGVIISNITALDAKLTSISNGIATITTTVGSIQTAVSNLNIGTLGSDVLAIKNNVATIQTSIGTLTADVSDIGLEVTSISGDIVTITTDLGTLQGTITSIDDGVATIQTDVGTVQADVTAVKADVTDVKAKAAVDMTPVWIAVVLSLVAAIAAVFAVITIRQKIAG